MVSLPSLPHDILLLVAINLGPDDLLSLTQTCRVLHALGNADYLWHNIDHGLPLDLSSYPNALLTDIPAREIKLGIIKALNLERRWRRADSKAIRIKCLDVVGPAPIRMQTLGRSWLLTLTKHRTPQDVTQLALWSLDRNTRPFFIAKYTRYMYTFSASLYDDKTAIIAVCGTAGLGALRGKSTLYVYHVHLKGKGEDSGGSWKPYAINSWEIEIDGLVFYIDIHGPVVGAAYHSDTSRGATSNDMIFFNVTTQSQFSIQPQKLMVVESDHWQFKLYARHIAVVERHSSSHKIILRVFELPSEIFSTSQHFLNTTRLDDFPATVVTYESQRITRSDYLIASGPAYRQDTCTVSILVTEAAISETRKVEAMLFTFPVDFRWRDMVFRDCGAVSLFKLPLRATMPIGCLGLTGHRAVWIDRKWNLEDYRVFSKDYRLMKATLVGNPAEVYYLQTPEHALPFEPKDCHEIIFDECIGRVTISLESGKIYIIDF